MESIDNLTEEQVLEFAKKYGLRPAATKKEGPYFQIIRGRAIRTATKAIAVQKNVVQKAIVLKDTHKTGEKDGLWTFEVTLEHNKVRHVATVEVDPIKETAKVLGITN